MIPHESVHTRSGHVGSKRSRCSWLHATLPWWRRGFEPPWTLQGSRVSVGSARRFETPKGWVRVPGEPPQGVSTVSSDGNRKHQELGLIERHAGETQTRPGHRPLSARRRKPWGTYTLVRRPRTCTGSAKRQRHLLHTEGIVGSSPTPCTKHQWPSGLGDGLQSRLRRFDSCLVLHQELHPLALRGDKPSVERLTDGRVTGTQGYLVAGASHGRRSC